ncbi:MAG: UDP-N-acetylmuramoyl-tripeptide--D-alanyl-D-alanine ligase [Candidatus Nealsonbacteria bacterium]|nr:UDP-N-acetylmuramoyl-tripeptide--D-alanyl-D-alanine ligase [Candidatus Nealsonbacteria bacterium]
MIFVASFLWLVIFAKKIFFWIWLWQLKEYHIGRLIDHFRTYKGKKLILNPLFAIKILAAFGIYFYSEVPMAYAILCLFFLEFIVSVRGFIKKSLKIPVLTRKTSVILSAGISFELLVISFLYGARVSLVKFTAFLLAVDIFVPVIASLLVLAFQPIAVAMREQALKQATRRIAEAENLLAIGVTGSYGKTSVKEFLAEILSKKYKVLKTEEHQNSEVGIANCITNKLEKRHEIFVAEMGAYNEGGIKLLTSIVKPKIGILTGINEQHMATFGSLRKTIKTKFELIEALPEDGLAILNYDDENIRKEKIENYNSKIKNVKFYSMTSKNADIWAENINADTKSLSFNIRAKDGDEADFRLNLLGAHNVLNVLGAAACAKYLGMSLDEISKACADIDPRRSGMQLKNGVNNLNILDSTYSSNPTGIISHLDYLKLWPGKKIIVMPCLIELGSASNEVHARIGRKIAEVCDLAIVTTKEHFRDIKDGASIKPIEVVFMEKPEEIIEKIKDFTNAEDIVLLESRVPGRVISNLVKKN